MGDRRCGRCGRLRCKGPRRGGRDIGDDRPPGRACPCHGARPRRLGARQDRRQGVAPRRIVPGRGADGRDRVGPRRPVHGDGVPGWGGRRPAGAVRRYRPRCNVRRPGRAERRAVRRAGAGRGGRGRARRASRAKPEVVADRRGIARARRGGRRRRRREAVRGRAGRAGLCHGAGRGADRPRDCLVCGRCGRPPWGVRGAARDRRERMVAGRDVPHYGGRRPARIVPRPAARRRIRRLGRRRRIGGRGRGGPARRRGFHRLGCGACLARRRRGRPAREAVGDHRCGRGVRPGRAGAARRDRRIDRQAGRAGVGAGTGPAGPPRARLVRPARRAHGAVCRRHAGRRGCVVV